MMRFIATQFYYPIESVIGRVSRATDRGQIRDVGFSILWFSTNTNRIVPVNDFTQFQWLASRVDLDQGFLTAFIDMSLQGRRTTNIARMYSLGDRNPGLTDEILNSDVIVQRSPPGRYFASQSY